MVVRVKELRGVREANEMEEFNGSGTRCKREARHLRLEHLK